MVQDSDGKRQKGRTDGDRARNAHEKENGRMSKNQAARRLRAADEGGLALRDTFTALIQEAHAQRRQLPGPAAIAETAARIEAPRHFGGGSPMLPDALQPLLRETVPRLRLGELVLSRTVRDDVEDLIQEVARTALLRAHSLEPRHTVMLVGPPGTGKTSLAAAMANELAVPFFTVRYDGLVGSYLGETASRLQQVVDYVSRMPCVLFFDEFDSVGKERSDQQETGEIKRVVSSLLLQMDALPSHCVIVCATNHPELLDRAVWRRFEVRLELRKPGAVELRDWYARSLRDFGEIGVDAEEFVALFRDETFSEIEAVFLDARRRRVLSEGSKSSTGAFEEAVARWRRRRRVGGETSVGAGTDRAAGKGTRRRNKAEVAEQAALPVQDLVDRAG